MVSSQYWACLGVPCWTTLLVRICFKRKRLFISLDSFNLHIWKPGDEVKTKSTTYSFAKKGGFGGRDGENSLCVYFTLNLGYFHSIPFS